MDKKFEEQKTKDNDKIKDDFHDFEKEDFEEIEENGEIILVCRKCVKFAREAPVDLKKIFKGNYGRIKAPNTGDRNKDKERRKRLADHIKGEMHSWCSDQIEKLKEIEKDFAAENRNKANLIVTSALNCLKELDGSLKFIRNNKFLELLLCA